MKKKIDVIVFILSDVIFMICCNSTGVALLSVYRKCYGGGLENILTMTFIDYLKVCDGR